MEAKPLLILHFEDNDADAARARAQLEAAGIVFVIRYATDETGFAAALADPSLDLILSDHSPPGRDGFAALALARAQRPGVPFIFCATALEDDTAAAAVERGAAGCVSKSRLDDLVPAIRRALAERSPDGGPPAAGAGLSRRLFDEHVDAGERHPTESAMALLTTDLARLTGTRFFDEMVQALAGLLGADGAFVAHWRPDQPEVLRMLAFSLDGAIQPSGVVPVADLPGEPTNDRWTHACADAVAAQFPPSGFLARHRIRGYCAVALSDTAGKPLGVLGVMARHALERPEVADSILRLFAVRTSGEIERQRSEQQFADLFTFAPIAIVMCDNAGRIVLANRQARPLFGWTEAELVGQPVEMLAAGVAGAGLPSLAAMVQAARRAGDGLQESGEVMLRRKDQSLFPAAITVGPMETESGRLVAVALRDLAQQKEAERQLLRAQRLESLGTLAGGIAHDLNNVLTPILAGAELIQVRMPEVERRLVAGIVSSAQRGADMVRQLLMFARGAEGMRAPIVLTELLGEIERIVRNTFPKNVQLSVHCPSDIRTIEADSTQIHQVLLNLCVNARDAMPQGGTLSLTAANADIDATFASTQPDAAPGPYVILGVADTGTGITPEVLDRMFDPFFTTKDATSGTGLGLSTVLGIVKGHHGFIQVRTELQRGTHFSVYLPAMRAVPAPGAGAVATGQELRGRGETILITDDEPLVRETMKAALERSGFNVVDASDGTGALVAAAQMGARLHAVVTDLNMPNMDGVALVRALRRILPDVAIVAVSGRHETSRTGVLRSLGVKSFLNKPYTLHDLLRTLASAVKR